MNVTIKDVAKAAGVSVATVSRVLNGSAAVSAAAAAQVNKAVNELRYSPNFLGRNLRKCGTNIILAVIPSTEHSFYSEIIRGMQNAALERGYDILIAVTNSDYNVETRMLGMLFNRTADAAVLMGTQLDAAYLNELNGKFYIGLCCERVSGAEVLTVTVDDEGGAYAAVKNFISCGHSRIAIVSTDGNALSSKDRESGYMLALKDSGIPIRNEYIYRGSYDSSDGAKAVDYFTGLSEPPTAVFCISDLLAAGAAKRAVTLGLKIGEDISLCGFDNIQISGVYSPGITTIGQPCYEIGSTVIRKLISNMNCGSRDSRRIMLDYELIQRESVGRPCGDKKAILS